MAIIMEVADTTTMAAAMVDIMAVVTDVLITEATHIAIRIPFADHIGFGSMDIGATTHWER